MGLVAEVWVIQESKGLWLRKRQGFAENLAESCAARQSVGSGDSQSTRSPTLPITDLSTIT